MTGDRVADPAATLADALYRMMTANYTHSIGGKRPDWIETAAREALAVLSATHAIVQLPEPHGEDAFGAQWSVDDHEIYAEDGELTIALCGTDTTTPDDARDIAAAILAAARRAEET
ncbi:hypothetical protein OG579_16940 [Williamsia herbipolensis]|uniref:Uncharacterized protein n=1 Tax=Williamsia herbipolensis TaxID=1603258 RepID=A0AAU4JZX7_9NOCA|nr:hypothetical protein [Williamsia herbipolensis]